MPVLLTEHDVRAVLPMDDLIAAMETALERFSAGAVRQPLRPVVEARSHTDALTRVRTFEAVRIWGRHADRAAALAEALAPSLGIRVDAVPTARDAAEGADVIALVTASPEPVLARAWVRDGAHICAV